MSNFNSADTGTQPTTPLPTTPLGATAYGATRDDSTAYDTIPYGASADGKTRPVDYSNLPRPRIRFGAIVWGLLVCGIAATVFWIATDDGRRNAFGDWFAALTPGTTGLIVMLVLGALLLLWGGLAAIRRSQERGAPRI